MHFARREVLARDQRAVLVLLHGYGSDENDLLGLAPELVSGISTICLRAPRQTPMGGYAWFDIDWLPTGKKLHGDQAVAARDALLPVLTALRDEFNVDKLLLGGFSQGAMMAFGLGRLAPELFSGLCLLSGLPLDEFAAGSLTGMPVLVQHGVHDDVIPVEGGRRLKAEAEAAGAELTYGEFLMGHQICAESLRQLNGWLADRAA